MALKKGTTMQEFPVDYKDLEEEEIHLSEYLMVLRKRKKLILIVFILIVAISQYYTYKAVPVFQASARMIVDRENLSSPITGKRTDYENHTSQAMTFNTNIKMMTSTPVMKRLIIALELDTKNNDQKLEINFLQEFITRLKDNIKLLFKKNDLQKFSHEELEIRKLQCLIETLKNKIKVEQIPETSLLNVSIKDKNPKLATDMANTLAKVFMEFKLSNKIESSQQTLAWLNKELLVLRKKLEDDEKKFFEYKQTNQVFSISGKQKQKEQNIQEFNNKYLEARNKRIELGVKINELNKNIKGIKGVGNIRSLINNPMIETIYAKLVNLEIELTRLLKIYKAKHPIIVQTRGEMTKTKNRLSLEIQKERDNLISERKVLFARETALKKTITEFETDALDSSGKELKYTILQRNMNTSQNIYDLMASRIKESKILLTSSNAGIRLLERAQIPMFPISKKKNFLVGIILGLFAGISLAFFAEYLDQTIKTEENIQKYLNIPVLSVVPKADKSSPYGEY